MATAVKATAAGPSAETAVAKKDGRTLFTANCAMCHQGEGQGIPNVFPPLAKSDYMAELSSKNRKELVSTVLNGKTGKIVVNGVEYNGVMTPVAGLDDEALSALLTYVTNAWGNKAVPFTAAEVKALRPATPSQGVGGH